MRAINNIYTDLNFFVIKYHAKKLFKHIVLSTSIILPYAAANAQQIGHNYITSRIFTNDNATSYVDAINYYDGLGRKVETVRKNASPDGRDLVSRIVYDDYGRVMTSWREVPINGNGCYIGKSQYEQNLIPTYSEFTAFHWDQYEKSPRNLIIGSSDGGDDWLLRDDEEKKNRFRQLVNSYCDSCLCRRYKVDASGRLISTGYYSSRSLSISMKIDEDGKSTLEFIDMEGRTLLFRQCTGGGFADTYYVYDNYGDLRYVLPPLASTQLDYNGTWGWDDEVVSSLCYCYVYNVANNVTCQQLPGIEKHMFAYDCGQRLVYSQNGNQRSQGKWTYNAYDNLGRLAYTAVVSDSRTQEQLQASLMHTSPKVTFIGANGTIFGYTASQENITTNSILSVNYYDNYGFISNFACDSLAYRNMSGYDSKFTGLIADQSAKGYLTGTATRVLGDTTVLVKSLYYDSHGNVIQSHESNAVGGYEHDYMHLTFTGKPLTIRHEHSTDTTHHVDINTMTYDAMERLLTTTVTHDGAQVDVITNTYDDLGRLASQSCLNNQQTTNYSYNIRNWVTAIDAGEGVMKQWLHYADQVVGSEPCFNGNISAMDWNSNTTSNLRFNRYTYSYDGMNRLTGASYMMYYPMAGMGFNNQENYSASYSYDLNSNITALQRYGRSEQFGVGSSRYYGYGLIDNLTITRDGNQLKKVTDQCDELTYAGAMDFKDGTNKQVEYTWDANGNMTKDLNKGIKLINYNILNLPEKITHSDGHITYITYAADGRKLNMTYKIDITGTIGPITPHGQPGEPTGMSSLIGDGVGLNGMGDGGGRPGIDPPVPHDAERVIMTRDYCGNYIYRNDSIERIMMGNGFWQDSVYYVQIKDYQGNVRAVLDQDHNLVERNEYYPYGGLINASDNQLQPYKYSAKELDRENGLDLYDSQARWYDPMLPLTTTQDPLAEKFYSISPYTWCAGNPVRFIDPLGMFMLENINEDNKTYQVVAVFPEERDKSLEKDYQAAKFANIPIITVSDFDDLKNSLELFTNILHNKSNIFTINSHGNSGFFRIGKTKVDYETDYSGFSNAFKDCFIFIGACKTGFGLEGSAITQKMSSDTHSTVITSQHRIWPGYKYDGSDNLNYYIDYYSGKAYKMSINGRNVTNIYDVTIDKNKGITYTYNLLTKFPILKY